MYKRQIYATRIDMSLEEALALFPQVKSWMAVSGRDPDRRSDDAEERQLADTLLVVRKAVADRRAERATAQTAQQSPEGAHQ